MFSNILSVALLASFAGVAFADTFTLHTPQLTQCQSAKLTWDGGNAQYALFVVPYNDPCGDAVAELGITPNSTKSWKVTAPAGSKVQLLAEDADGNEAWSGIITVGTSDDASCVSPSAIKVLSAAGALAANLTSPAAGSSAAAAASAAASSQAVAPSVPAGNYPTSGSGASDIGIANAAAPTGASTTSASMPRAAVPAASILGLTTLLFSAFLL